MEMQIPKKNLQSKIVGPVVSFDKSVIIHTVD